MEKIFLKTVLLLFTLLYSSYSFYIPIPIPSGGIIPVVSVYLKSGKVIKDNFNIGEIEIRGKGYQYLEVNRTKVFPSETDSIIVNGIVAYPMKQLWFFKMNEGEISLYTNKPFNFINTDILGWQINNGDIKTFDIDSLKEYIKDDKVASYILTNPNERPDPIRAVFEFNTKSFITKREKDSLYKKLKMCRKCTAEEKISVLNEILALDSLDCNAIWELAEIYSISDPKKACNLYAFFFKHNFKSRNDEDALKRIFKLDSSYIIIP